MGQKEADEWLALQSKRWEENFPGAPFADGKTVIGLLDRLAALEAERDALRKERDALRGDLNACFALLGKDAQS